MKTAITIFSLIVSANTWAQPAWPAKSIRFIAPFAPGGGTDFIGRVAAQKLTEGIKQQVIVDNRPGAGGTLGAELGAKAPPDGYTFTIIAGSYSVNPAIYKIAFDPVNDITPVIQFSQGPLLVVVHPALPIKNVKDMIALAKSKPGALNYSSGISGSGPHLGGELFKALAGVAVTKPVVVSSTGAASLAFTSTLTLTDPPGCIVSRKTL